MLVNTGRRCTRCGGDGDGELGTELWLCEHGVQLCFHCFVALPCRRCVEKEVEGDA